MKRCYFDNAATTPMSPAVIAAQLEAMQHTYGNASSTHATGRAAFQQLDKSRQVIATSIHARPDELIFTNGGTESDNTALCGIAYARQQQGRHIITTEIEHPAILNTAHFLEKLGFELTYLPVNSEGVISLNDLRQTLRPDTILVSIMTGNNEVGSLQPIKEIGELLKPTKTLFHTDAVQAYGLIPLSVHELGIDLLSVSAHKIHGPKGTGFLYVNSDVHFEPLLHGGDQEHKRRAGTENVPAIVGFAAAVQEMLQYREEDGRRFKHFKELIMRTLKQAQIPFLVNGPDWQVASPHVFNIWLKGVPTALTLMQLDLKGFSVSAGSACTAGSVEPSHVLTAMYGASSPRLTESLRISFGHENTEEEVEALAQALVTVVQRYQVKHVHDGGIAQ